MSSTSYPPYPKSGHQAAEMTCPLKAGGASPARANFRTGRRTGKNLVRTPGEAGIPQEAVTAAMNVDVCQILPKFGSNPRYSPAATPSGRDAPIRCT